VLFTRIANFAPFDVVLLSDDVSMSRLVATRKVSRALLFDNGCHAANDINHRCSHRQFQNPLRRLRAAV
jgi:hypothetical protein